ncbi:helix-turn-helix transcriptional regulator [Fulvivirga sp. 29W222]|uniref:Helix-turn-helix transcriptional regulator n=1 Tax=Fulvivirga marina TaxID=2494733 RepID=A0A937FZZ7_9BACT|nr:AraC family transcriptional regulator [Fulvivirga marina]MBL6449289.1 helix-turn-helix transcriptional regulator [Fulvivirga marina]
MEVLSIKDFYQELLPDMDLDQYFGENNEQDIGHFNVFDIAEMWKKSPSKPKMPYNRRTYYKISLVNGQNKVEYADRVVDIEDYALIFATPKVPYRYYPLNSDQKGYFCVFTGEFLSKSKTGTLIDELPIFNPASNFVYHMDKELYNRVDDIFNKMQQELSSDYAYKYDLLRTYLLELIHFGQKLQPLNPSDKSHNASNRISSLFIELLERQFPIESTSQRVRIKSANEFAASLNVHVNHLNKVLKEVTGKTTSDIIKSRLAQEAKILLRQTQWNISEIAFSLGFEEIAHFSNFFKTLTSYSPSEFRNGMRN